MDIAAIQRPASAVEVPPERLAGNKALTESQKIAEASRQFEAILLRQILGAAQKTVIRSEFTDDSTSAEIYRDMATSQMADAIARTGTFGLAKTFQQQLEQQASRPTEPGI